MLKKKEILIPADTYEKHAVVYHDTDTVPKACILYFHGGGLLYGTKTDLPDFHVKLELVYKNLRGVGGRHDNKTRGSFLWHDISGCVPGCAIP